MQAASVITGATWQQCRAQRPSTSQAQAQWRQPEPALSPRLLHHTRGRMVSWLPAASDSADSSSMGDSSSGSSNDVLDVVKRKGKKVAVDPGLAARLELLAAQCGVKEVEKLAHKVAAVPASRQQGMIDHGLAVEAYLRSLRIKKQLVKDLLLDCPYLFSFPVEARASVLFGQLMGRLGMTASAAAKCFSQQPFAAAMPTFKPAIAVLSALLAAGSEDGKPGEQLLGEVLAKQPAAVLLLAIKPEGLQSIINYLIEIGLDHQQIVELLPNQGCSLLARSPAHLAAMEAVLQQELGGDRQLWLKMLRYHPRAANTSVETFRKRAQALVAEFGRDAARKLVNVATDLLGVRSSQWQCNLAVMRLLSMTDPHAVAHNNAQVLAHNWVGPALLVNLLALQRCMPGKLSTAQVVGSWAGYVAGRSAERVVGRLLYLEQVVLLKMKSGKRPASSSSGEPGFISLRDVCVVTDAKFAGVVAAAATKKRGKPAADNGEELA